MTMSTHTLPYDIGTIEVSYTNGTCTAVSQVYQTTSTMPVTDAEADACGEVIRGWMRLQGVNPDLACL